MNPERLPEHKNGMPCRPAWLPISLLLSALAVMLAALYGSLRAGGMTGARSAILPLLLGAPAVMQAALYWRRRTGETLRQSENFARSVLDSMPAHVAVLDREGKILQVNEAWKTFARENGAPESAHAYVGTDYFELCRRAMDSDDPDAPVAGECLANLTRLMRGEIAQFDLEYPCHSPDQQRWFLLRATPLAGNKGITVMSHIDITARKLAEEAMSRSGERLRLALEAGGMAIWDWNVLSGEVIWNDAHYRMLGYEPGAAQPSYQAWADRVHPEDRAATEALLRQNMEQGGDYSAQFRTLWPNGIVHWLEVSGRFVRNTAGRPVRGYGVMLDITERKQLEETQSFLIQCGSTATGEGFFQALARYLAETLGMDFVCIDRLLEDNLTAQTVAVYYDGKFEDNVAYALKDTPCRDAVGRTICCIPRDVRRLFPRDEILQQMIAESYVGSTLWSAQGRPIGLLAVIGRQPLANPQLAESVLRLASVRAAGELERKEAEEALLAANVQLAEADRRKDEFLAMLAHELRNPLAPVRNAVHILRAASGRPEVARHQQDVIDRQVTHMARLLDDLLDVSRITQGKIGLRRQRLCLADVLLTVIESVTPLMQARRHTLHFTPPADELHVEGDIDRLTQVVGNLLINAVKYTETGGQIWLEAFSENTTAVIHVRDTGMGIAPELLPKVFNLFTQADRSLNRAQGGLGIGLTMVRKLVELHGGTVEAHSAGLGHGSEFIVRLPAVSDEPAAEKPAPGESDAAPDPHRTRRVLVVDDVVDSAASLAELIGLWGHVTRTAHDGPEALQAAGEFRPDVILLDIGLPGMDGIEVARRLRSEVRAQPMRLIALTGYGQSQDHEMTSAAGFNDHLVKPVDLDALQKMLT